ncbi:XK-related protein 8-like [Cynoglossus semilaevis]|uniref:XK-related protein n=1 Tax=Cynoglossus semilaevis TaxID=244447 RepID=A0A3P8VTM8_CYNSE|nr:XK-related protein 8-like [Cynoglossus semilaevis]
MAVFRYSPVDFIFTCLGLVFLVLDIALDIFAVVSFYQEEAYVILGVLVLVLVGSSILVQVFSWLWYSYEEFSRSTVVEKSLSLWQLGVVHLLQLGAYVRHAGVMEMSVRSFFTKTSNPEGLAVFLAHDLSMLRLIETFSESSPQLVLMLTIMLQRLELHPVAVLKALGSTSAIACSVTMYHRSLRSFLPDKANQKVASSLVYFSWNLFLISSRLVALALFASVLPWFIFAHFLCSWLVLFFCAWRCQTSFMDSSAGEWLFRATVGLIWYFNWFNVVEGKSRNKALLYHGYMLLDICLLCGLWFWKMSTEASDLKIPQLNALTAVLSVVAVYILGLFLKTVYYKFCHPNLTKEELKDATSDERRPSSEDVVDSKQDSQESDDTYEVTLRSFGLVVPPPSPKRCNKRMRKLAESFYA